jgi:hypothetical protein
MRIPVLTFVTVVTGQLRYFYFLFVCLLNEAVLISCTDHVEWFWMIWKETFLMSLEVLSQRLYGGTEESHVEPVKVSGHGVSNRNQDLRVGNRIVDCHAERVFALCTVGVCRQWWNWMLQQLWGKRDTHEQTVGWMPNTWNRLTNSPCHLLYVHNLPI